MSQFEDAVAGRRTFAIISHPDAGKTTITEKLLLLGNADPGGGQREGQEERRHATSDWMSMEQERGISVTSSVMQFPYRERTVNLLDTPGHEDFSEDTYRTLTAVDSALMVIDGAKGVEDRTIKLMNVCRLRDTPIFSFVNKMDRDIRDPIELLDEIETVLQDRGRAHQLADRHGHGFKGVYNLYTDTIHRYTPGQGQYCRMTAASRGLPATTRARCWAMTTMPSVRKSNWCAVPATPSISRLIWPARLSPVFFGTALGNFGVREMLDDFVEWAPAPRDRDAEQRQVAATEDNFCGFVFKIQANMDPRHRDRIAFLRICSGRYSKGMKMQHVRIGKEVRIADAVTFKAGERALVEEAIAATSSACTTTARFRSAIPSPRARRCRFTGIPHFAPELFRRIRLTDPMKSKQLQQGLAAVSRRRAPPRCSFRSSSNDLIVGAVGQLQFEVVAYRLKDEYKVEAVYEPVNVYTARWISCDDAAQAGGFQGQGGGQPRPRWRRPPHLPGADPGQSGAHRRALSGHAVSSYSRALMEKSMTHIAVRDVSRTCRLSNVRQFSVIFPDYAARDIVWHQQACLDRLHLLRVY